MHYRLLTMYLCPKMLTCVLVLCLNKAKINYCVRDIQYLVVALIWWFGE